MSTLAKPHSRFRFLLPILLKKRREEKRRKEKKKTLANEKMLAMNE